MYRNYFGTALVLCVVAASVLSRPEDGKTPTEDVANTTEPTTWDKLKKGVEYGWQVVYDESHCALHKAKGLVKPHDHENGSDPCANKPYQQTTTAKTIVLVAEDVVPATQKP